MKGLKPSILNKIKWGIGILFTLCIVYFPIFFMGYKMSFTNFMYTVLPWKSEDITVLGPSLSDVADRFIPGYYSTLKHGFISLWNSHLSIGSPGDIWLYLYPMNYLYFLPESLAMFLNSVLQFGLGFLGMYLFLKEYSLEKLACVIGGISYTFASALVLWHGWPHSDVAFMAPFLFLLYEKALKNNKVIDWISMSIIMFFMLVCGMPTYAAYFFYLLGFYVLIKTILLFKTDAKKILKIFIPFGLAVVFAALASLPYTIELLGTVGANGYNASRKSMAELALDFAYLRNTLFPLIRGDFAINANESTFYNGVICLLAFPLTFFRFKEKKAAHFWVGAFGVCFCIVYTHIFDFIYKLMPAINTSIKYRNLVLLNFIMAILFAINMTDVIKHKADYYNQKKIRIILSVIFVTELILYLFLARFMHTQLITVKNQYDYYKALSLFAVSIFVLLLYFCILPLFEKATKIQKKMPIVLLLVLMIDLGLFAEEYIPYIKRDLPTIPAATDSISYLQENTGVEYRYAAIGNWTLFPQTNMYYNISDIRSHSLMINTNADLKDYFTAMYPAAYEGTGTRLAIKNLEEIASYPLLKYLGCKYIAYDGTKDYEGVSVSGYPITPIGDICKGQTVHQTFEATANNLDYVSVRVATYGKELTSTALLKITLTDADTQECIETLEIPINEIEDDSYIELNFPAITDSMNKTYELTLSGENIKPEDAITAWTYGAKTYDGVLGYNEAEQAENSLVIRKHYSVNPILTREYVGKDNLTLLSIGDVSKRAMLIDHVVQAEDEILLKSMSESYEANTLFLPDSAINQMKADIPLTKADTIDSFVSENDQVTICTTLSAPRYLLLNDYYNKWWNVYVDGKKTELVKANYLMRAVYIDSAGTHTVEFKYEPTYLYILFSITAITFVIMILLFALHTPLEKVMSLESKQAKNII